MAVPSWSETRDRWAAEPFRRHVASLAVARMISTTGTRAATVALLAVVYSRSGGSGCGVAGAGFTQCGRVVVTGPWPGAIGDRLDRRVVMLVSDLAAAAAFVAI